MTKEKVTPKNVQNRLEEWKQDVKDKLKKRADNNEIPEELYQLMLQYIDKERPAVRKMYETLFAKDEG